LGAFVVCFGSFATALSPALAEVWPERGVKIITSFPAGTGADLSARLYAERLALRWGKPVIVENKPGADGILAVTAVIGARDNHTLLYTNGGPVTTNGFNHDKLPYDPVRDLIPISSGADVSIAISIPASLKIDSLADFIAFARAQPGKLNWGATMGALDYVVPSFLERAGLDLTHVSYREIAPALQDLAEGRIHLYVSALARQLGMVGSGNIKVIAITNLQAIPKGGAVVVYDMLIDDERCTAADALLSSLNMLLWTNAGLGYGGSECADWMSEAGFSDTRVEPLVAGQSMVTGQK